MLLEVLDARDPLACRATEVERFILSKPNKRVILVLNKIDLVPAEVVQQVRALPCVRHAACPCAYTCAPLCA